METPALAHMVGGYFHQDWADDFGDDPATAVDAFVRGTPDLAPQLPAEIDRVLTNCDSEEAIERYLASLGSCLTPAPEDGGYRGWLTEVARRVRAETEKNPS